MNFFILVSIFFFFFAFRSAVSFRLTLLFKFKNATRHGWAELSCWMVCQIRPTLWQHSFWNKRRCLRNRTRCRFVSESCYFKHEASRRTDRATLRRIRCRVIKFPFETWFCHTNYLQSVAASSSSKMTETILIEAISIESNATHTHTHTVWVSRLLRSPFKGETLEIQVGMLRVFRECVRCDEWNGLGSCTGATAKCDVAETVTEMKSYDMKLHRKRAKEDTKRSRRGKISETSNNDEL